MQLAGESMREWRAVMFCERNGRSVASYHGVSEARAHEDLARLWLTVLVRAERLGSIGLLQVIDDDRKRSVMLTYPPIDPRDRARSDDAHASTIEEAIAMLTRRKVDGT